MSNKKRRKLKQKQRKHVEYVLNESTYSNKKTKLSASKQNYIFKRSIRNILKYKGVLLENINKNEFIEIQMYSNYDAYSITTGNIATFGQKRVKYCQSKKTALDKAVKIITHKLNHGFTMVETEDINCNETSINGSFFGYSFSLSGCFSITQSKLKKQITNNDGKIHSNPIKCTNFVIVRNKNANIETSKCIKAKQLNIPIITENFIYDSIKNNSIQN
eukprot:470718_1